MYANGFEMGQAWCLKDAHLIIGGSYLFTSDLTGVFTHRTAAGGGIWSLRFRDDLSVCTWALDNRWFNAWLRLSNRAIFITFWRYDAETMTVEITTAGTVRIRQGGAFGTIVATSATNLNLGVAHWYQIELYVADATDVPPGYLNVYVDDNPVPFVSYPAGDTLIGSYSQYRGWNAVRLDGSGTTGYFYIDDIIITNATEGKVPECYGVLHVPDGAGDSAAWSPTGGANWQCVVDPADEGTYVETTAGGLDDLYALASPTPILSVAFVKVVGMLNSQAAMGASLLLKSGGVTSSATAQKGGCGNYSFTDAYWLTNPATGLAFTEADIQGLQIGLRS